jgi:hypothetical protein
MTALNWLLKQLLDSGDPTAADPWSEGLDLEVHWVSLCGIWILDDLTWRYAVLLGGRSKECSLNV